MDDINQNINEISTLSNKYKKLVEISTKIINDIDNHTSAVLHHLKKVRETLGIEPAGCSICCKEKIKYCVEPCYHCFCEGCAAKSVRLRTCFFCRGAVRGKHKIFIN